MNDRFDGKEIVGEFAAVIIAQHSQERNICGIVKWYNVKCCYGFINRNDTKEDVFVHQSGISKNNPNKYQRSVGDGEPVQFDLVRGEKGLEAVHVTGPNGQCVMGSRYATKRRVYNELDDRFMSHRTPYHHNNNSKFASPINSRHGYGWNGPSDSSCSSDDELLALPINRRVPGRMVDPYFGRHCVHGPCISLLDLYANPSMLAPMLPPLDHLMELDPLLYGYGSRRRSQCDGHFPPRRPRNSFNSRRVPADQLAKEALLSMHEARRDDLKPAQPVRKPVRKPLLQVSELKEEVTKLRISSNVCEPPNEKGDSSPSTNDENTPEQPLVRELVSLTSSSSSNAIE